MSTRQNLGFRLIEQRRRRIVVAANSAPNTPTISAGTPTSSGVTLTGSAFSDPDVGDTHAASQWQVTTSADTAYNTPVISTGDDATNKTSYAATGLTASTAYIARVRYKDSAGNYSAWATSASFTTAAGASAQSLVFDGTAHYPKYASALPTLSALRIEARIRAITPDTGANQEVFSLPNGMEVYLTSAALSWRIGSGGHGGFTDTGISTPGPAHTDYLMRAQLDGSTGIYSLELWATDGSDRRVATFTVATGDVSPTSVVIGNSSGPQALHAKLDFLRIYNTVVALNSAPPSTAIPAAGACVSNWEFEGNLSDSSGNGRTLVWQGGGAPTFEATP